MEDFDSEVAGSFSLLFFASPQPQIQPCMIFMGQSKTTTNYHHLDVSRDDGMDEHEIHWLFAKQMEDFGFGSEIAGNLSPYFITSHLQQQIHDISRDLFLGQSIKELSVLLWCHERLIFSKTWVENQQWAPAASTISVATDSPGDLTNRNQPL
jgi:hypothetical protein